jgi:hypothetical protein
MKKEKGLLEGVKKSGTFTTAFFNFVILALIIMGVSWYFVFNEAMVGPVFLLLGLVNLGFLKYNKIELHSVYPDIVFGAIDNGVLVLAAVFGGELAGVAGAIIGGAAGNTITDGIGGLFEGHIAEDKRNSKFENQRTALSSSLGKMAGCLFGAGLGLVFIWAIKFTYFGFSG